MDVARLRALQHGITATGTLDRLESLAAGQHINTVTGGDTADSFRILLAIRLRHQARCRANHLTVDNIVEPDKLSPEVLAELKQALRQLKALQDNLQHEFGSRP